MGTSLWSSAMLQKETNQRSRIRYPFRLLSFVETAFSLSTDSRKAVVSYLRNYVKLGCLSIPRSNVVRLADRPDMSLAVYRERKATTQQQQQRETNFVTSCLLP